MRAYTEQLPDVRGHTRKKAQTGPFRRRTLTEQVVEYLLGRIRSGEVKVGQRLPTEKELTGALRVSRTCVREALKSLESLRVVRIRPRIGAVVLEPSATALLNAESFLLGEEAQETGALLGFRMIIEVGTASLAAEKAGERDISIMETVLAALEKDLALGNPDYRTDIAFHAAVAAASRNPMAVGVWEMIAPRLTEIIRAAILTPAAGQESFEGHMLIFRAIKEHDPGKARAAMRAHLEASERIWRTAGAQTLPLPARSGNC